MDPVREKASQKRPDSDPSFFESKSFVLIMLFFVTAVLGLPLLWFHRSFSKKEKWVWSIAVVLYTLVLVAISLAAVLWAYSQIIQLV